MGDDVTVLEDEIKAYADGTVARIRILAVPESEKFPDGVKYAFHYGEAGSEGPIIRFDNHHGVHELHTGPHVYEIDYPGLDAIYQAWRAALPAAKRPDW
ncbi:DUF6516 family protein [Halobacterium salinarum]|uniref:toxin-antitoxin system TumE family protein n=1 Tax=Halobacterium salinarum TaxID=2242 RepID=UPI0025547FDD|nr:DUF6516 family protein [Halobacterium salinarum]MDL0125610.1 DUF6516 family protein [Halobacterium salinarum]